MLEPRTSAVPSKTIYACAVALLTLLFLGMLTGLLAAPPTQVVVYDGQGALDLRGIDFGQTAVTVNAVGTESYPGVYLTPDQLHSGLYTPEVRKAHALTQRLTVLVPDHEIYTLYFHLPGYAARVYINGRLVDEAGHPGLTVQDTVGGYIREVYSAVPENGRIELVVHIANFHQYRPDYASIGPTIGREALLRPVHILDVSVLLQIGALFGVALLALGIFLSHPMLPKYILFSLSCTAMAVREWMLSPQLVQMLPFISRMTAYRIEYLSLTLLLPLLMQYLEYVFPGMYARWARTSIITLSTAYAVIIVFMHSMVFTALLPIYTAALILALAYSVVRLVMRMQKPASHQIASFAGCFVLILSVVNDLFYNLGIRHPLGQQRLSRQGMLAFVLIQMTALYIGNVRQIDRAHEVQRTMEERNAALDRMSRLKTEFLGNVSHELKTPLTVISGYAQSAQLRLNREPGMEALSAQMKLITSEAERLALMVTQMLDVTRIEEGRMSWSMQPTDIHALISETIQTYYPVLNKNRNRLVLRIDENLPPVTIDASRIAQVLVNLLSNAIRHTRRGDITVSASASDGMLYVSVADTGEGIDPTQMDTLFERYQPHKKNRAGGGTGLGLYISRYIVEAHGGRISAESSVGAGSIMRFTLPLQK